jgi:hypothetical protein
MTALCDCSADLQPGLCNQKVGRTASALLGSTVIWIMFGPSHPAMNNSTNKLFTSSVLHVFSLSAEVHCTDLPLYKRAARQLIQQPMRSVSG